MATTKLWVGVVTLFPEMLTAITQSGITSRAVKSGQLTVETINPRDFTTDAHRTVDDRPYGGGPGMVMKAEPLAAAIRHAKSLSPTPADVVLMSPKGQPWRQEDVAATLAASPETTHATIVVCGRYEGIDQRVIDALVDRELSLGDFILSGGEIPAMAWVDALTRLLPGALGHAQSAVTESFSDHRLEPPHYTRPETFEGRPVPDALLSGNHARIERWRARKAVEETQQYRPDLLAKWPLTDAEQAMLSNASNEE